MSAKTAPTASFGNRIALPTLILLLALLLAAKASAKDTYWTNGMPGIDLWSIPGNWSGGVPEAHDRVFFTPVGGTSTMDLDAIPFYLVSMVGYTGTLYVVPEYGLLATDYLLVDSLLDLGPGAIDVAIDLRVDGELRASSGQVTVGRDVEVNGRLAMGYATLAVGGNFTAMPGAELELDHSWIFADGHVYLQDVGLLDWPSGWLNCTGGLWQEVHVGPSSNHLHAVVIDKSNPLAEVWVMSTNDILSLDVLQVNEGVVEIRPRTMSLYDIDIKVDGTVRGAYEDSQIDLATGLTIRGAFEYTQPGFTMRLATGAYIDLVEPGRFTVFGDPVDPSVLEQDGIAGGMQWYLFCDQTVTTVELDNVRVQDSNAYGTPTPLNVPGALDGGNNTNWTFGASAVDDVTPLPTRLQIAAAPNPFNPATTISFHIPTAGPVSLRVYDVSGALVRVLVDSPRERGQYRVNWDGCDDTGRAVGAGMFLARLASRDEVEVAKVLMVK